MHDRGVIRYIIRSKDRVRGTPNDFQVALKSPIPTENRSMWVKVQSVNIPNIPYGQPRSSALNHGFDTRSHIDICSDLVIRNNSDTEQGHALKNAGERTLISIPYSRRPSDGIARNIIEGPWLQANNPGNMGQVSFKLFSDLGLPLTVTDNTGGDTKVDTSLNVGIAASVIPIQTLTLSFGTAVAGMQVGQQLVGIGATAIKGDITIVEVISTTSIVIGFTRQVVPAINAPYPVSVYTGVSQQAISDWSIELLVRADPPPESSPI
jgi:hypothetical protein